MIIEKQKELFKSLSQVYVIGITGGSGSGQTTVAKFLKSWGVFVIHADEIARSLTAPGCKVLRQYVLEFGETILNADGTLNRQKLGQIIFADPIKKARLNAIIRPSIRAALCNQIHQGRRQVIHHRPPVVVVDAALIYEWQSTKFFHYIVVVSSSESIRIQRLIERDGLSETVAQNRIRAQLSLDEKIHRADVIIDNNQSLEWTRQQTYRFWRSLMEPA